MRRILFSMITLMAVTVTMAPPADAHRTSWNDPDQSEDASREMEIHSVIQRHPKETLGHTASSAQFVSFDIQTFAEFDSARLSYWQTEHWALMIGFSLDDRPDFERMIHVDAKRDSSGGHNLVGVMTGGRARSDSDEGRWVPLRRVRAYVGVGRPYPHVVRVFFPESALKRGGVDDFKWRVRVVYNNRAESEECGCTANSFDYAPPSRLRRGHT